MDHRIEETREERWETADVGASIRIGSCGRVRETRNPSRYVSLPSDMAIPDPDFVSGCVTSSYLPVQPAKSLPSPKNVATSVTEEAPLDADSAFPGSGPTIFEMQPFPSQDVTVADVHPNVAYQNHVYIYPTMLKYDSQRQFSKARNICCWVEFRDNDSASAAALKVWIRSLSRRLCLSQG